jgi:hypothetical protein
MSDLEVGDALMTPRIPKVLLGAARSGIGGYSGGMPNRNVS